MGIGCSCKSREGGDDDGGDEFSVSGFGVWGSCFVASSEARNTYLILLCTFECRCTRPYVDRSSINNT